MKNSSRPPSHRSRCAAAAAGSPAWFQLYRLHSARHTDDLARRAEPTRSADLGAFFALLAVLPVVAPALGSPRMDPRSLLEDFYGWFMGFFSFWASGPPHDRLHQLRAAADNFSTSVAA